MSDAPVNPELFLPFPIEFLIWDTPRSQQSNNTKGKEQWKRKVGAAANAHARTLRDFFLIDERPLAATIFYFLPAPMDGDVDNIVKLIVDGMITVIYPHDRLLERIVVQKFEPEIPSIFSSLTPTLEQAAETDDRPVIYIRIDDDLAWRNVA